MGNGLEVHCCCCRVKFGSSKPKSPKKQKNEQSSLLYNTNSNQSAAAIANSFNPNPTIDVTQFNSTNTPDFYTNYGAQPYQNLGITDLRQAPPFHQNVPSVIVHSDGGSNVKHGHSSSYDSLASSGVSGVPNGVMNMNGLALESDAGAPQHRRSTVADPFSNDEDDDDDDTDLDSDYTPNIKSNPDSNRNSTKMNNNNNISKIMDDNEFVDDPNGILNNRNSIHSNHVNNNDSSNNIHNPNQNGHNGMMSDGIISTDDVDNEENVLSATDIDEEDKLLHDQSSDQQTGGGGGGNSSNVEDTNKNNKKKVVNLSGVDESDDSKIVLNIENNEDNSKPPLKGTKRLSKTTGIPETTTGSDSDNPAVTLLRAQTTSNWTDQKLQDLEDEMRYEFEKLQIMQQHSDLTTRTGTGSISNQNPELQGGGGGMPATAQSAALTDMQAKMEEMLKQQKQHLAVSGGSGNSQADNDTTDYVHDDTPEEYSDDDEMAQMKAKMKEMLQNNNSNAFGS